MIEDACHALGAEYRGRRVGSIAHMTVFSFHPVKHMTTGEGGMVTTDNPNFAETLRRFRNHGISSDARQRQSAGQWHYEMVLLGFNYRLDRHCLRARHSAIEEIGSESVRGAGEIAAQLRGRVSRDARSVPPAVRDGRQSRVASLSDTSGSGEAVGGPGEMFPALRAENIGVNVHYIPVHRHPYYRDRFGYRGGEYPVAEDAYERLISLPMFHGMTDQDVEDVIRAVEKVISHFRDVG